MKTPTCPTCRAPATGKFCAECGAPLAGATCRHCEAPLTPGARFCHRCGTAVGASSPGIAFQRGKAPWIFAAVLSVVLVGWVIYRVERGVEPAPPPAGRVGGANAGFSGAGGPPDLSQMTGKEAFLRLHDRIMGALEQGDTATAAQFMPMALRAYTMVPTTDRDIDIRYHAATLMLASGDIAGGTALADSLGREVPGHLFVSMLRAGIAEANNDPAAAKRAYQRFLADWDRQLAARRPEYEEHRELLDAFKQRAESLGR